MNKFFQDEMLYLWLSISFVLTLEIVTCFNLKNHSIQVVLSIIYCGPVYENFVDLSMKILLTSKTILCQGKKLFRLQM